MQVPALKDGGTELGMAAHFFVCNSEAALWRKGRIFVTKHAKISQVIIGATRVLATSCADFTDLVAVWRKF
jgi:hypothetical protein